MRFYKQVKTILEAVGDVPPPPPALVQKSIDSNLTFDEIFSFIKDHEGIKPAVYKDTLGVPTIGIGFNMLRPDARRLFKKLGVSYDDALSGKISLTDQQIKDLFILCLKIAYADAKLFVPSFDGLPKDIKLGLLDLSFNLGYPRLSKFKKTKQYIIDGQYDKAALELKNSKWATQVGRRANSIIKLFSS
ncbi:MAG: hypothetical protein EBU90_12890 [Proteobacteria bacterium]|nr:hypothetical protein [Pseudomonadota bacterium]NBP15862.1 hypothetical protein [bacterium]